MKIKTVVGFTIVGVIIAVTFNIHGAGSRLFGQLGLHIPSVSFNWSGSLGSGKAKPMHATVSSATIDHIQPVHLRVDGYISAKVIGAKVTRTIPEYFGFAAHPKVEIAKNNYISVDGLIGIDEASSGIPAYQQTHTKDVHGNTIIKLVINPNAVMAIQLRVIPNQHNTNAAPCNKDWGNSNLITLLRDYCSSMEAGIINASVYAVRFGCLPQSWNAIRQIMIWGAQYQLTHDMIAMKQIRPDINWKRPKLVVTFSSNLPAMARLEPGFSIVDKAGKPWVKGADGKFLVQKGTKENGRIDYKVDLSNLRCKVDKNALTRNVKRFVQSSPVSLPKNLPAKIAANQ